MKSQMMNALLSLGLIASAHAAQAWSGVDQNNQACELSLQQLNVGPTVWHDACFFEIDGRGPWCDDSPKIATNKVTGSGTIVTAAGTQSLKLDDKYGRLLSTDPDQGFSATSSEGNTVVVSIDGTTLKVQTDLLTDYAKTLTPDQRNSLLTNLPAGQSYEDTYKSLFTNEACTIQNVSL